jgi:hypothetical protein
VVVTLKGGLGEVRGRGAQLTARLHPVPTLKMNKAVFPIYHMSSRHADKVSFALSLHYHTFTCPATC